MHPINTNDIDFKILFKSENFFDFGNIFVDDDYMSYFKFGSTTLSHQLQPYPKEYTINDLIDLFEDHQDLEEGTLLIEIEDIYSTGREIVANIRNQNVKDFCENSLQRILDSSFLTDKVERLNELVKQAVSLPSEIPPPVQSQDEPKSYARKIFTIKNQYGSSFHRVTIPRRIILQGDTQGGNIASNEWYQITLVNSAKTINYREIDLSGYNTDDSDEYVSSHIDNNDGSTRANIPLKTYEILSNNNSRKLIILRSRDKKINFKIFDR